MATYKIVFDPDAHYQIVQGLHDDRYINGVNVIVRKLDERKGWVSEHQTIQDRPAGYYSNSILGEQIFATLRGAMLGVLYDLYQTTEALEEGDEFLVIDDDKECKFQCIGVEVRPIGEHTEDEFKPIFTYEEWLGE